MQKVNQATGAQNILGDVKLVDDVRLVNDVKIVDNDKVLDVNYPPPITKNTSANKQFRSVICYLLCLPYIVGSAQL